MRQFLWEESDAKTAATNLRKFLLRIRQRQQAFGFELIREERDHVRLGTEIEIDLAHFLQIRAPRSPGDLIALCDLYRGELLEGVIWDEPETQAWLEAQRTRLKDTFVAAVSAWMERAQLSTDKVPLRVAARRLIEVDPYNETAHRTLMQLFADEGEQARVRDVYRNLEGRLHADLGVQPDAETTTLLHSLAGAAKTAPRPEVAPMSPLPTSRDIDQPPGQRADVAPPALPNRSGRPRITLLPPVAAGRPDYGHQIAASLIEDVTIGLCRFKAVAVVAPHTAWELSQNGKRAQLQSFSIDYSVETYLQNREGKLLLAVKLINVASRDILWAEQYEFSHEMMARHYRELSMRIVLALVDRVERTELARYEVEQHSTAYHMFLLGQQQIRVLDLPSIRRARRAFKASVSACFDFVPAISGLARSYQLEWLLLARGDAELLGEAARLAKQALEIDPDDARGHRELGICHAYAGRFDESLTALAAGEQRNPQHADLLNDFAEALVHACEPGLALEKITQAIELNPLCPDQYWWSAAGANYQLEKYAEAVSCMERMRDQTPALRLLAASWGMLGNQQRAADYARLTKESHPDFRIGNWLSIMPFRDPRIIRKYEEGLRAAGFE